MAADDVAVIGGGLIGVAIAFEAAKRGARVVVFDRAEPGRAASWAGAGMLAPFSEQLDDAALLTFCAQSLAQYADFVAELRERSGVDAKLRFDGTLHVAHDEESAHALDGLAHAATEGGARVQRLDRDATRAREVMLGPAICGGVFVENEAQVDNRRLHRALVGAARALGVRFEHAGLIALEVDARRVRGVRTDHGFFASTTVVNAAGAWAGDVPGVPAHVRVPVRPIAGEMIALAVPRGFARSLVWSGATYLVPRVDGRLLIGATVVERGFDERVTAGGLTELLMAALRIAPALRSFACVESWAGLRPGSHDGRPYIGASSIEGYFIASGHYRNGILLAPITGKVIAAMIAGEEPLIDLAAFDPLRVPEATNSSANQRVCA